MAEGGGELKARGPAPTVFISYASQDSTVAAAVCEALERAGVACWIAPRDVTPGEFYADAIVGAINASRVLVVVLTRNAVASPHVLREVERASSKRHPIVAFRIDSAPLPPGLEYFLSASHWLDATTSGVGAAMPRLVEAALRLIAPTPAIAEPGALPQPVARPPARPRFNRTTLIAAALAVLGLICLAAYNVWQSKQAAAQRPVAGATPAVAAVPAVAPGKSIAVLPFENLTGRAEDAYLADGLQEEILNALARVRDLKVISRTSAAEFRGTAHGVTDVGRRLGVGSVLEGSIRREGNTLRLTIQLIDARDDHHMLATNYDRDLAHVLGLQSEVARQVAEALAATLSRSERGELERVATNSGDAYNRYLRAVALFRQPVPNDDSGLVEPKRLLEEALRLDPDYADALALLSQAYTWSFFLGDRAADGPRARQAFERALAIDPALPEARLARGMYEMYVGKDLERASADFEAVVQQRPSASAAHFALGLALRRRGRFEQALEHLSRAWDLDPLNHAYDGGPLTTLLALRRYPEAIEQTKLYGKRFPADPDGYYARADLESYLQHSAAPLRAVLRDRGDLFDPALRSAVEARIAQKERRYLDAVRLWDSVPREQVPSADLVERAEAVGMLYSAAGAASAAGQVFRGVERDTRVLLRRTPDDMGLLEALALAQSMLGEHEAALATIGRVRDKWPEAQDPVNGPNVSFVRSIVLVRAGRTAEGYAEVARLERVPFGAPLPVLDPRPWSLLLQADPRFDVLVNHVPRL